MSYLSQNRLSERDIDFLVETLAPEVFDKVRLKQILREDEAFRKTFIEDEKVFRRLMDEEEAFLKISPRLFFEILLRKTAHDLEKAGYTFERSGISKVPVFDTKDLKELLATDSVLLYLADMLSSFTKIESYAVTFKGRTGTWEKIRFNDLDILSLTSLSQVVEDEYRLGFYKRIADICLFILGIFPEYVQREYRYPFSGQVRPQMRGRLRISPEGYEEEGEKFYKLAAEHHSAKELDLAEVFWSLHENFKKAKKPLNFISDHYLQYKKHKFFA